jgi:hypothetical protein
MDDLTELKRIIIEHLAGLETRKRREIAAEFNLSEEKLDELARRLLNEWLNNPELIMLLASELGLSMPRSRKEKKARYID